MKLIQLVVVTMTLVAVSSHTAMAAMSVVIKSCTKTVVVQGTLSYIDRVYLFDVACAFKITICDQSFVPPSFPFLNTNSPYRPFYSHFTLFFARLK